MQGPNFKKLVIRKMARDAVPDGGGFADGLRFLSSPKGIASAVKRATEWVQQAINAVKAAPDNSFGNNDEAIANEILRQLDDSQRN